MQTIVTLCGYEWKSLVKSRVKGRKCPVCADRAVLAEFNDLATTDPKLLEEWDYDKNGEVKPENVSRYSMKSVWWKCQFGHSWKDAVANRALLSAGCVYCEKEFQSLLPQLLIMLYCSMKGLDVELDSEARLGIPIDAYIPELSLAIIVDDRETKKETAFSAVAKDLCVKRGILLRRISTRNSLENICVEVKKALQSANLYIATDSLEDIEKAHKKFFLMKSRNTNKAV